MTAAALLAAVILLAGLLAGAGWLLLASMNQNRAQVAALIQEAREERAALIQRVAAPDLAAIERAVATERRLPVARTPADPDALAEDEWEKDPLSLIDLDEDLALAAA